MPLLLSWKAQCSCTGLLQQFKQKDISIINIQFCSSNCKQEGEQACFVVYFFFRFLLLPARLLYCWKGTWTHKTKESGKKLLQRNSSQVHPRKKNLQYGCATFNIVHLLYVLAMLTNEVWNHKLQSAYTSGELENNETKKKKLGQCNRKRCVCSASAIASSICINFSPLDAVVHSRDERVIICFC